MISILYNAATALPSLYKSRLSGRRKVAIVWWYLCILVASVLAPLTKQRRIYCAGFVIEGFDMSTLRFLFEETFLRQEYNVELRADKPVCIDAGANIGMVTLFLKWLYPSAVIIAIEPDPATCELLRKNIAVNTLSDVTIVHAALSKEVGEMSLFVHPTIKGSLKMSTYARKGMTTEIKVPCRPLSDILSDAKVTAVDLAKIDIEGAEWQVQADLLATGFWSKVDQYVLEYHHHMGTHESKFGLFLAPFDAHGYWYQCNTRSLPYNHGPQFQDILLYAKRMV
jgi:FkbM family methyltransferase